jgi:hypothetical protein
LHRGKPLLRKGLVANGAPADNRPMDHARTRAEVGAGEAIARLAWFALTRAWQPST